MYGQTTISQPLGSRRCSVCKVNVPAPADSRRLSAGRMSFFRRKGLTRYTGPEMERYRTIPNRSTKRGKLGKSDDWRRILMEDSEAAGAWMKVILEPSNVTGLSSCRRRLVPRLRLRGFRKVRQCFVQSTRFKTLTTSRPCCQAASARWTSRIAEDHV
jgi:hypothetical protein